MRNRKEKINRYRLTTPIEKGFFNNLNLNLSPSETESNQHIRLLDTFDWRLYKKGLILKQNKNKFDLYNFKLSGIITSAEFSAGNYPLMHSDFPESDLREKLSETISIRALIQAAAFIQQSSTYNVLNSKDKTVARLEYKEINCENKSKEGLYFLILKGVRGYDVEFNKIDTLIKREGIKTTQKNPYLEALTFSERKPDGYSSKFRLEIDPTISSAEALRQILHHLINTIKVNEKGIKEDIDIEFLHDFRVAVRRARSGLSQIKYVFPESITSKLKNDFSKIGKMTNRLRDLDVYLQMKNEYVKMLPAKLKSGIEPVFNKLEKERSREQKKLKSTLNAKAYKSSVEDALKCLETDYTGHKEASNSGVLIKPLAKKFIWKKYKKVVSSGLAIDENTPDEKLHELRIECKKLRYLLEFFNTLFPAGEMTTIITQLKKLQDNLGDFNDFFVQQESLAHMLDDLNSNEPEFANITMSIGGLIAILSSKQNEARKEFNKKFKEFAREENQELYGKLFS